MQNTTNLKSCPSDELRDMHVPVCLQCEVSVSLYFVYFLNSFIEESIFRSRAFCFYGMHVKSNPQEVIDSFTFHS